MQKVNIDLLPPPSNVIKATNINIFQWGWVGFTLNQNILAKLEYSIEKILNYIIDNGEGIFFILIQDIINNRWIFFTDRFSCKKIFYFQKDDKLYFSDFLFKYKSRMNLDFELDVVSIGLYLIYGYIPTNDTLYKSIKSIKPFSYYIYQKNQLKEYKYYDIEFREGKISYSDAVSCTSQLLEQSFLDLTRHHKHFLIPLSGGRDSRLLLALALKHYSKDKITTFTFGQKGTLDFEIGKGLAKRLGCKSIILPFDIHDYFDSYVYPGTKFKNGLINHSGDSLSKLYEGILRNNRETLIISGYSGDVVLTWAHGKRVVEADKNFLYPEPSYFNFKVINECFSDYKEELVRRFTIILKNLHDERGNIVSEKWFYYNRAPFFLNICLFAEEQMYPFALPFVDRAFFEWIKKVPAKHKQKASFYKDILRTDDFIYSFFQYPLKNFKGVGYEGNKFYDVLLKSKFIAKALVNKVHRSQNYINLKMAYKKKFLEEQISFLNRFKYLKPIIKEFNRLSFRQKCLLLSLKLNLEYFS